MTDDDLGVDESDDDEVVVRRLPTREAQAKQAFAAIALVFFLGIAIGFALAKSF